jgi:hypothetical protein
MALQNRSPRPSRRDIQRIAKPGSLCITPTGTCILILYWIELPKASIQHHACILRYVRGRFDVSIVSYFHIHDTLFFNDVLTAEIIDLEILE